MIHVSEWGKRTVNMKKKTNDFELVENLPVECQDPEIKAEDFVLATQNEDIHEQRFVTKPTTFFKDSLKRFAKNKSSVVAAVILGILVLLGLVVPILTDSEARSPYNTSKGPEDTTAYMNLEPRLFTNAGGFWDGTVKKKHIPIDTSSPDESQWLPDPIYYKPSGISNMKISNVEYTNVANKFGRDGYLRIGYYGQYVDSLELTSSEFNDVKTQSGSIIEAYKLDLTTTQLTIDKFETVDADKIRLYENNNEFDIPENVVLGELGLNFAYSVYETVGGIQTLVDHEVTLIAPKVLHNTGTELSGYSDKDPIDLNALIIEKTGLTTFENGHFTLTVTAPEDAPEHANVISLIKNLNFSLNENAPDMAKRYFLENNGTDIPGISFTNAMTMASRTSTMTEILGTPKNIGFWAIPDLQRYVETVYLGKSRYADFTYDTYEGQLGVQYMDLPSSYIDDYAALDYLTYSISVTKTATGYVVNSFKMTIKDTKSCPIVDAVTIDDIYNVDKQSGKVIFQAHAKVYKYKVLGMTEMPSYLMGTDKTGRDMFKYTFEGLRNSLALGVLTFIICFAFGLVWGAICGYFGGTVDLIMERITDILAGLPWIVAMTLIVLKTNSRSFGTFLFALCITGWIGTAARTRTQFYRFRGREYVLASRTLGASDARLIAKHILPNSLGTIITGAVLMIPSVIFSEATISYLGLGFQDLASLGVILSNNQDELTSHPYQLIFPSIVIALLMISFNLFGNGLRDAINPSLKGEEE